MISDLGDGWGSYVSSAKASSREVETAVERPYLEARIIQLVGMGGRMRLHVAPMPGDTGRAYTLNSTRNLFLVRLQCRQHPFLDKLVYLLGWTRLINKRLGVQQVVQKAPYRFKIRVI